MPANDENPTDSQTGADAGRIETAFAEVVALPTLARAAYLARLRASSPGLADEVESLLRYHERPSKGLPDDATFTLPPSLVGSEVGGCTLERLVGYGGMSAVYAATQRFPRRRVAVKIVRPERLGASAARRLRVEAEALARLEHPNIARVYAAGAQPVGSRSDGTEAPYIVMELVEHAVPVTRWADARGLGARERIELAALIADAVEHAHRAGVIHRDLKPGNVVVGDDGSPKIIDFGIAAVIDSSVTAATEGPMGTLAYMSPEQARGGTVDTRSDVWGLGALLYDLLAGRPPFGAEQVPLATHLDRLLHDAPEPVTGAARAARGEPFTRDLPPATDDVIRKAMATHAERRYRSAGELADELRHLVRGEPLLAAPDSDWDGLRRLLRRHRTSLLAATGVFAAVVGALFVSVMLLARERESHARADWAAYIASISAAGSLLGQGDASAAADMLADAPEQLRGWEWDALARRANQSEWREQFPDGEQVYGVAYSADGRTIFASASTWFTAIDAETRALRWRFDFPVEGPAWRMRELADGNIVCVVLIGVSYLLAPDGTPILERPIPDLLDIATSADRTRLFGNAGEGACELDPRTLEVKRRIAVNPPLSAFARAIAAAPDASFLVTGDRSGEVVAFDAESGAVRWRWRPEANANEIFGVSVSPDGSLVAAAGSGHLALFDAATGAIRWKRFDLTRGYRSPAFTPDGRTLFVASYGETVDRYRVDDGTREAELVGAFGPVWSAAVSPDGRSVAAGSLSARVDVFAADDSFMPAATSLDGSGVVDVDAGRAVHAATESGGLFRIEPSARAVQRIEAPFRASAVCELPDGTLAVGTEDGVAWLAADGTLLRRAVLGARAARVGSADEGRITLAVLDDFRQVALDTQTAAIGWTIPDCQRHTRPALELPGQGRALVPRGQGPPPAIVDVRTGALAEWKSMLEYPIVAALSPDGRSIAVGCVRRHGEVTLLDARTLRTVAELPNHRNAVRAVCWSPDGSRIASCGGDDTVRIWHAERAAEVLTAWRGAALDIDFGSDATLWIACADGMVRAIMPKNAPAERTGRSAGR